MRPHAFLAVLLALAMVQAFPTGQDGPTIGDRDFAVHELIDATGPDGPADVFARNLGQIGDGILYYNHATGAGFARGSVALRTEGGTITISFAGANDVGPVGIAPASWPTNYIMGDDPAGWHIGVANFRGVAYIDLWDGIDLVYSMKGGELKYDIVVHPGADASNIEFVVGGFSRLALEGGELLISAGRGSITDSEPCAYYADGGTLDSGFRLTGPGSYTIDLEGRDPGRTVIIDPLMYSTYVGGAGAEIGTDVAVGPDGSAYITGCTDSTDFSEASGLDAGDFRANMDVFVTKFDSSGHYILYTTYLGGREYDRANALVVDAEGNTYITGVTYSGNFPTTPNAADRSYGGVGDAFVAKLGPDGSLAYSTFLGGSHDEEAFGISVDGRGQAYVTGGTWSATFPVTPSAHCTTLNGDSDAFVTKVSEHGDVFIYSSFLGGTGTDVGRDVAVLEGSAYVAGTTLSNWTVTNGSAEIRGAREDLFAVKINTLGTGIAYSAVLGGRGTDRVNGVDIGLDGRFYLAGETESSDFPIAGEALDGSHNGRYDAFAMRLDSNGALDYSTYLGGSMDDAASDIVVDASGFVHLTGWTGSGDFPVTSRSLDRSFNGGLDAFVAKFPDSGGLDYSCFLGGDLNDMGAGIGLSDNDCVYVGGQTWSDDFPLTDGVPGFMNNGGADAFLTVMDIIQPVADAGPTIVVNESTVVRLNGSACWDNVGIANYTWSLFDGVGHLNLYGQLPEHRFDVPGYYDVVLSVRDALGNADSDTLMVIILEYPIPIADAGSDLSIEPGEAAFLNGTASTDNVAVTGYRWAFDDGVHGNVSSDLPSLEWVFERPGTYRAWLTVHDAEGHQDTAMVRVSVADAAGPEAVVGQNRVVPPGQMVALDGSDSRDDVGIVNYTWTFRHNGTEVMLYGQRPSFEFWDEGTTTVTLTVMDAAGNSASNLMAVTVIQETEGPGTVTHLGLGLLAAAIVLSIMFLILRRRRKTGKARKKGGEP